MSHDGHRSEAHRLPPIGFEDIAEDVTVKPLKKKKKKNKGRLKTLALASQSFGAGHPRTAHHYQTPSIDRPPHPRLYSGVHSGDPQYYNQDTGEVRLRRNAGTSREDSRRKRFTVSDLEAKEPAWLREKGHAQVTMNGGGRQDVRDLLRKLYNAPERDRIDYVITHNIPNDPDDPEQVRKAQKRQRFEKLLEEEGFILERETIGRTVYCKLHCTFPRLCKEAEGVKMQMPLKNMEIAEEESSNCFSDFIENTFETDNEVDFVSAPFEQLKLHLFKDSENPDIFFRSSLRCLLTDHCLKHLDMRKLPKTPQYYYHHDDDDDPEEDVLSKQGLPYLLMRKVYNDAFILHDESEDSYKESQKFAEREDKNEEERPDSVAVKSVVAVYGDARHDMNEAWPSVLLFQPLWMIRNYFGEEIALYFAWVGLFISSIIIPMFIGLAVFAYGLICSASPATCGVSNSTVSGNITGNSTATGNEEGLKAIISSANSILDVVKEAFDNNSTPWYAITICIWSTIFLELWKRKNAVLAYEWDVDNFEDVEPDRPEYFGTHVQKDPVTLEDIPFYPFEYKCVKYSISLVTFLFMVCVVFAIVMSVIAYRVVIRVEYCTEWDKESGAYCFIVTTICSSLLNATAILVLGKLYEYLAVALTDWENHRTPSQYRNALIIKLFAFQFANCYSSLYYIAFFRTRAFDDGILNLGANYNDSCGESCMSELSFQVFVLMIIKPLPRILKDVVLPWVKKKLSLCCKSKSTVDPESSHAKQDPKTTFLETEKNKPLLNDFTLNEYTEKVIQYGFIVLFAAAMPLGPLIAVLVNTLDRVVDSKRLLWMYRRPLGTVAENIGMWYNILEFLNIAAVITNAFLIAYVSDWGIAEFGGGDQLWVVLAFEHAVFLLKYILAIAIPDVPHRIRIAMRKEKFTVAKILETGMFVKHIDTKSSGGSTTFNSKHRMTPEGEHRVDSANADTVTARNVTLDTSGTRHRVAQNRDGGDVTEGGYTGDAENDSPRKSQPRNRPPADIPPLSEVDGSSESTTSRTVQLDYGAGGNTYMKPPELHDQQET